MNRINFIKPVPPSRIREVRIWFWITCTLLAATLAILATYTVVQWRVYRTIHKEKHELQQQLNSFSSVMETEHKQVEDRDALQHQLNKLNKYSKTPKSPIEFLSSLRTTLGTIPMQSFTLTKNNFELHILCTNAQQANFCLQKLTHNSLIRSVKLVSLQTHQKQLMAVFKGEVRR